MPSILSKENIFDITYKLVAQNKISEASDIIKKYAYNENKSNAQIIIYQAFMYSISKLIPTCNFKSVNFIKQSDFYKSILSLACHTGILCSKTLFFLLTNNDEDLQSNNSKTVIKAIIRLLEDILEFEFRVNNQKQLSYNTLVALFFEDKFNGSNLLELIFNPNTTHDILFYFSFEFSFENALNSFMKRNDNHKYNLYIIVDDYAYEVMSDLITEYVTISDELNADYLIQKAKQVLSNMLFKVIKSNYHLVPEYYKPHLPYYKMMYRALKYAGYKVYIDFEYKKLLKENSFLYDKLTDYIHSYLYNNNDYYYELMYYMRFNYMYRGFYMESTIEESNKIMYSIHPEFKNYTYADLKRIKDKMIKQYTEQIIKNPILIKEFLNYLDRKGIVIVKTDWKQTFESILLKSLRSLLSNVHSYYYIIQLFNLTPTSVSKEKDLFTMILIMDKSILKMFKIKNKHEDPVVITLT